MTSVLAPQGVGLWGQNLHDMSATGSYARLPPDAYNKNSIGQRGGDVRVPLAQVGPSAGTRPGDPMGKQAAALIVSMSPYPLRTLRDGLIGGGRDASAIRVPLARVTPTEAEIATRIAQEAKSEAPSSAMPVTLNQAIELLKAAEEGWSGDPATDAGYAELVADARRLKDIRAVAKRRPIRDDEQTLINSLADKYSGAIETAVIDSSARQQALIAKRLDTSAQGVADADAMRADLTARFAPHDREKKAAAERQADAINTLLGPRFDALPQEANVLARDTARAAADAARDASLVTADAARVAAITARDVTRDAAIAARDAARVAAIAARDVTRDAAITARDVTRDAASAAKSDAIVNAIASIPPNAPNQGLLPVLQAMVGNLKTIADDTKTMRAELPTRGEVMPSLTTLGQGVGMLGSLIGDADIQLKLSSLSAKEAKKASNAQPGVVKMMLGPQSPFKTTTSSSSSSSVPDAVVDPNDVGGVMIGQTTTTTSSPSPGTGKNRKAKPGRS
jgi:hypothetical protein